MTITGLLIQTYFSIQHAQSAALFAREAFALEKEQVLGYDTERNSNIIGYACGSLLSSIAFLEALVNELYADAAKEDGGHLHSVDADSRELIAELGKTRSVERASATEKFAILLRAARTEPPDPGARPAQDVQLATDLRNALVHYKAHWLDYGSDRLVRPGNFMQSRLYAGLRKRFENRPGPNSADSWLGYGCASWALQSVIQYADAIFSKLKVTPIYDHVRAKLDVT